MSTSVAASPSSTRSRIAAVFLVLLGLGALVFGLSTLLVPFGEQARSVAPFSGQEYADVQIGAFARNPWLVRAHAAMGSAFVLIAALQFWHKFRNADLRRHRWLGYAGFTLLVLLPATGILATFVYPFAGWPGVVPNIFWGSAIVVCVTRARTAIKARDVTDHEAWALRATAMTIGITLSRLYEPLLVQGLHLNSRTALATVFWLGQGEGLIAAEIWLRRPGSPYARRLSRKRAAPAA